MEKRKATTSSSLGLKKPRLTSAKEPPASTASVAGMSDVYISGDFTGRLSKCWRNQEFKKNEDCGAVLYARPYQLCVLPEFISSASTDFLPQLREELCRLKFMEKNNDLYQFHQKYGVLEHQERPSTLVTFYTTLVTLSQIALRLERASSSLSTSSSASINSSLPMNSSLTTNSSCNNTNSNGGDGVEEENGATATSTTRTGLKTRALSAVMSQIVTDACNYALEMTQDGWTVDCRDLSQVANYSLHQYYSSLTTVTSQEDDQELEEEEEEEDQQDEEDEEEDNVLELVNVAEAYTIFKLLTGIFPLGTTADPDLRGPWSDDFKRFKSPCINEFRDVLQEQCLPWLREVTGIELTSQIDITCSKYEFTDYLLCHDDQLEGRRIAFIFYLTQDWTPRDGGCLEIFDTDESGHPRNVVFSIPPVWNNFIFFEVSPSSFHRVGEILDPVKTRLSINGWFHGPPGTGTPPKPLPPPLMFPPTPADLSVLSEWVSEMYLDVGTQSQVQAQFEVDSQIELPNFLLEEKYGELCKELEKQEFQWKVVGPPNKRCMRVAEEGGSMPEIVAGMMKLFGSEPFCRLLSHLTGLDLALNIIRLDSEDLHGNEGGPCSSSSLSLGPGVQNGQEGSPAEVKGELQHWRPGSYSLVSDQDHSVGIEELHLLLHFCCEGWTGDSGGMRVYIATDEEEELLSVCPSPNALSLVYCDKDTLSFTKYINHRTASSSSSSTSSTTTPSTTSSSSSSASSESSFFSVAFIYRETA